MRSFTLKTWKKELQYQVIHMNYTVSWVIYCWEVNMIETASRWRFQKDRFSIQRELYKLGMTLQSATRAQLGQLLHTSWDVEGEFIAGEQVRPFVPSIWSMWWYQINRSRELAKENLVCGRYFASEIVTAWTASDSHQMWRHIYNWGTWCRAFDSTCLNWLSGRRMISATLSVAATWWFGFSIRLTVERGVHKQIDTHVPIWFVRRRTRGDGQKTMLWRCKEIK